MNKDFAWFLGFLLSDGSIVHPAYRSKGDESHISFCLNIKDSEVLYKIKSIINTKAAVRLYPDYKSPSAVLAIYDRKDLVKNYQKIKVEIPEIPSLYRRHFMRGLVDGDGCLHQRKDRNSFRINFINQNKEIVNWFSQILSEELGIEFKTPKWKKQDNLWIVEWEGKIARLIAWFLYHGDVSSSVLDRKKTYYEFHILEDRKNMNEFEEFIKAIGLSYDDSYIHMNVPSSSTLKWCHIVQKCTGIKSVPVFHNKGKNKYYSLYLPSANTQRSSKDDKA